MRTRTSYYMCVILFAVTAMMMLNLATCRTRTVYSNTWVVQVDGGQAEAERIAAEKDLVLLGQVREQSLVIYLVVIAVVISYAGIAREFNLSTDLHCMRLARFCLPTK